MLIAAAIDEKKTLILESIFLKIDIDKIGSIESPAPTLSTTLEAKAGQLKVLLVFLL